MIDRFEKFSAAISDISRYWHKLASEEMEKYGLKGPHTVYFTTMYRFPEGLTSVKLAELCSKDKSDVSRATALFEKKGLVVREGVNNNLYRALLKLTDEGKKVAEQINETAREAVRLSGKGLSDKNREIFYDTLERICANLQELSETGLPRADASITD